MRKTVVTVWPMLIPLLLFTSFIVIYNQTLEFEAPKKSPVAIVVVLTNTTEPRDYEVAIKSVECYARAQKYEFLLVVDSDYDCPQKDKFFRRHCVVSLILPRYETVLFIDADHGVVNPKRRIEEFMDPQFELVFYDRFFNWEVMAGSYIARSTPFTIKFLSDFANFENQLPKGAHGSDNGAIHLFLAENIFPESVEVEVCREVYYKSANTYDVAAYEACIRGVFGVRTDFGKIRIMRKGTGWSRDDWLTSGLWNAERDFMLHGWKTKQMKAVPEGVLEPLTMDYAQWYNPFAGPTVLERCFPGNTSWSYNPRLLGDRKMIENNLAIYAKQVEKEKAKSMGRLVNLLEKD